MLLLTIGIHHSTGPTATQTDGQRGKDWDDDSKEC